MKISIQGGVGSYSHIAVKELFGADVELLEHDSFAQAFKACSNRESDYAVIPFENSTHGSVHQNYDLITKHNLRILKEIYLKINFHLLALPDVRFDDVKNLYTHPVSLSQINSFLEQNPQIDSHAHTDNGLAAKEISTKKLTDSAAAASKLAGELFGLEVLRENIHDNPKNYTRFFVLSNEEGFDQEANKTTLQYKLKHEVGTLSKSLSIFSELGISLSKIESRPIPDTEWEYTFYVDILAGMHEDRAEDALNQLEKHTEELIVLGSYMQGKYIET